MKGQVRVSGLETAMSDVLPSPKNAFDVLMAASAAPKVAADDEDDEPEYTAVLYEAHLEHADPKEPLWRVPYFGQVVRQGPTEVIFAHRKRQHETDAAREDKDLGFHAVVDQFGTKAIAWRIVSSASGPRIAMQELANAEEVRLIDENGGVLRDMDAKLTQTLNLMKGGNGDARAWWSGIDARRRRAFTKFKAAMEEYVKEYGSALVPNKHVDDDGYRLGAQLADFRIGKMRKGLPEETEINAWAEALPNWEWNARNSAEWREDVAQRAQERSLEAFGKFKASMEAYVDKYGATHVKVTFVDDNGYPLGMQLAHFRKGRMWKGTPWEEETKAWIEALPEWSWNGRVQGLVQWHATKRRAELERARTIAVPFEKSRKRRAELRAASEHAPPLGKKRGNSVLYMVSEDRKTIRRVKLDGGMQKRDIVGPVVDPLPVVPEAGPSDLNAYVSDSESD